jgi:hypothetical protein
VPGTADAVELLMVADETCAVMMAIFPIILLTVVLERRAINLGIHRAGCFRTSVQVTTIGALAGLLVTIAGVQLHGLHAVRSAFAWLAFLVAFCGLALSLIAVAASDEVDEDRD